MVNLFVDFDAVTRIFERAMDEGRTYLFEHEVYELVRFSGGETLPRHLFLPINERLSPEKLDTIPGTQVVVKILSPIISHKSDVGGVRIVEKNQEQVLSAVRALQYEVPEKFADLTARQPHLKPSVYGHLKGQNLLNAIRQDIHGILICQYIPEISKAFGNELLLSLRRTQEFGMVIAAGLGGTDTELYAQSLKKGRALITEATHMTDGDGFFNRFCSTLAYKNIAGLTRGHQRVVTDEQLLECFSAFIALANVFSPLNPQAPFVIEDLEINPFAFSNYLMFPLDGKCRFSKPVTPPSERPLSKIDRLLHPRTIGIMGVSSKSANVGRIILKNILANGFDPTALTLIHPKIDQIDGIQAFKELRLLPRKVDLLILAVGAEQIPHLVDLIIDHDLAESVLLIPGGIGEKKGSRERVLEIQDKIRLARQQKDKGPLIVGGNSLGILSHPGKYDTFFIPDDKLPKHRGDHPRTSAFISQSGAYMITRMSKLAFLDPAYAISIGNQIDMTAGDFMQFLSRIPQIKTIAAYMEGFRDLDGLSFAQAVRHAVSQGKDVLFYKAGRTPEGKTATSSHTASMASDYMICESCMQQAGAMVASTFTGFEGLFRLSAALHDRPIRGNRLAAVSNAGYESVGIADNIWGEDYRLKMAALTGETRRQLLSVLEENSLNGLVDVKNPLDLTPMATSLVYESVVEMLLKDTTVDAVIAALVPLTPLLPTLPREIIETAPGAAESLPRRIGRVALQHKKPLVIVVDSGKLFDPLADAFQNNGLPVFRSADQAVWVLGKYIQGRLRAQSRITQLKLSSG